MVHTNAKLLTKLVALDDERNRAARTSLTKIPPLGERPPEVQRLYVDIMQLVDESFPDVVGELSDDGFLFLFERGEHLLAILAHYAKHISVHIPYGLEIRRSDFDHGGAIVGSGRFNQRVKVSLQDWPWPAKRRNLLLRIVRRSLALAKKHGDPYA
jgi:hypothetical protein